jgi:hypothetical protein
LVFFLEAISPAIEDPFQGPPPVAARAVPPPPVAVREVPPPPPVASRAVPPPPVQQVATAAPPPLPPRTAAHPPLQASGGGSDLDPTAVITSRRNEFKVTGTFCADVFKAQLVAISNLYFSMVLVAIKTIFIFGRAYLSCCVAVSVST